MNSRQEDKTGRIRRVKDLLGANTASIALYGGLTDISNLFLSKAAELFALLQEQDLKLKGITEDKALIGDKVTEECYKVSNLIQAYADGTGNHELYEEAHRSMSDLKRMRDDELLIHVQSIYLIAGEHLAALTPLGYDAVAHAHYANLISNYEAWVQKPLEARSHRHNVTLRIEELIRELDSLMKRRLDTGMAIFRGSNKVLYDDYCEARRLFDTGSRKREETGNVNTGYLFTTVRSATDNIVIAGAKLYVDDNLIEESDEDGEVYAEALKAGVHKVVVECEGFIGYEGEVTIEEGDELNLEVVLETKTISSEDLPAAEDGFGE